MPVREGARFDVRQLRSDRAIGDDGSIHETGDAAANCTSTNVA